MNFSLSIITFLFFIIPISFTFNFDEVYKKMKKRYYCTKKCWFDEPEINSKTIDKWPGPLCDPICGILTLNENTDVSYEKLKTTFERLVFLNGGIRIENTSFTNLTFLPAHIDTTCDFMNTSIRNNPRLENMDTFHGYMTTGCSVEILDNPSLNTSSLCENGFLELQGKWTVAGNKFDCGKGELVFQELKHDDNYLFYVYFYNLHPDFCLTIEEMAIFLKFNIDSVIQGRYCQDLAWSQDKPKICTFSNMRLLENGCVYVYGNLLIESGDESYVEKLRTVTHVLGTVTVRNTKLEGCGFLEKLQRVANLNDSLPVMQFLFNKNLRNFKLPSIKRFVTSGENQVIIKDNHPDFFKDIRFCAIFQIRAKTKIVYNGQDCKAINTSLPEKIKFNFNKINFKKDYETAPNWYYDYEETISKSDFKTYQTHFKRLQDYNNITVFIAFVMSIPHLFVLFQKELRESWIYVLITGICICNFIILSTFFLEQLLGMTWNYESKRACTPKNRYYQVIFHILKTPIKESARRCASLLTFYLTFLYMIRSVISNLFKPFRTAFLALVTFSVLLALQFFQILPCKILLVEDSTMCDDPDLNDDYLVQCGLKSSLSPDFNPDGISEPRELIYQVDGFFTVIIGIMQLITILTVLFKLRFSHNRRISLSSKAPERSEDPSKLIILIAITFFLFEAIHGGLFLIDKLFWGYSTLMEEFKLEFTVLPWTLVILNSKIQLIGCYLLSEKYSNTVKRITGGIYIRSRADR